MKNLFIILAVILCLTACEKEIDLALSDQSGKLVIEGNVTNQPGPYYVQITKTVAFTQGNQYPAVEDATVIISDNAGQKEELIYEGKGRYKTINLTTVPGNTYTLTVILNGVTYSAISALPKAVMLDSLEQDSIKFGNEVHYAILPKYTDPPTIGNYYRFLISVNGKQSKAYNLISDNIDNGKVNQRAFPIENEDDIEEPNDGDLISVEMHCVDAPIYAYYTTLSAISEGGPGGGVTPSNPPSNISNGAFGRFSAHTVSHRSIVLKKSRQ